MAAAISNVPVGLRAETDGSTKHALQHLEELLVIAPERVPDAAYFATLAIEFTYLHARIRAHYAATCLQTPEGQPPVILAERTEEWDRLCGEPAHILGMLDLLIRQVDSIADQGTEDKDVFILRVKELIAVLHRHDGEEDRLFAIALWKDTGGES